MDQKKFKQFVDEKSITKDVLPAINKKSDKGRYLFNKGQTQFLFQPWYSKHYKFWGSPFKPFYRTTFAKGCGLIFVFLMLLLIVPSLGFISVPYPISTTQNLTFSNNNKPIFLNGYASESVYLSSGNTISYNVKSDGKLSFAIWDQSFDKFPVLNNHKIGMVRNSLAVRSDNPQYMTFYMHKDDSIKYDISMTSSGAPVDFFITNSDNFNLAHYYVSNSFSSSLNGTFVSSQNKFYYIGVAFSSTNTITRGYAIITLNYNISSANLSNAYVNVLHTQSVEQNTFTAPKSGNYRVYMYFDPFNESNNLLKNIKANYNINVQQKLNSNDNWIRLSPVLKDISILIVLICIFAFLRHYYSKKFERVKQWYYSDFSINRACYMCFQNIRKTDDHCPLCGTKLR